MNTALIRKTARDYLVVWVAAMVLLFSLVMVFMLAVHSMPLDETTQFLRMAWVRKLVNALVGADLMETMTPTGLAGFIFSHPMTWVLLITFLMTASSGGLAGEVDRGTMDLLAALPISRPAIYVSLSIVILLAGLPLCGVVWLGVAAGRLPTGATDVQLGVLGIVACNLYAAYCFLACFSLAVSSGCSRRGTSLAIAFVPIFYSFVLNLVGAFWEPAKRIAYTGFLHYYAPLPTIRDGTWPWRDMAVLAAAAIVCWGVGLVVFSRRDVPAR
ncbi:MAG: ABC transporter permease subunit [Planctomycetota bacterium]